MHRDLKPWIWTTLTTVALASLPAPANAHFLWISLEPTPSNVRGHAGTTVRVFLNETPTPGGPEFLHFVRDVRPTVDGQAVPTHADDETVIAHWAGRTPATVDASKDLGIKSRDGKAYRLFYTARSQTGPVASDHKEELGQLRARLVASGGQSKLQVLLDGKPKAKARLRVVPLEGDPTDAETDDAGEASIAGLAEGKTAVWANWIDGVSGESDGKPFGETRFYATLTIRPKAQLEPTASVDRPATAIASMSDPAVNSFGGAVLGDWLYVYSGHVGKTHEYSVQTTSRNFRRLNLKDGTTWESLPMARDVQGVALVTDGTFLYRVGGMTARNQPGEDHDLVSSTDFARFDPSTRTWTDLPPLPQARSTHDAVVVGRTVYAVGGWEMKGETDAATFVDDVAAFDLDRPEQGWRMLAQPFRRRALSVAAEGTRIYVLGGLGDDLKVSRRVDVLDTATGTWSQTADLPGTGRNDGFGTSAFAVDGRVYFSGAAGRIFSLDPTVPTWEAIGAWNLPRITHRILPGLDHSLLAVGGNHQGKQTPVIESIPLPTPVTKTTVSTVEP